MKTSLKERRHQIEMGIVLFLVAAAVFWTLGLVIWMIQQGGV